MAAKKEQGKLPELNVIGFEETKIGKLPVKAELISPAAASELLKSSNTNKDMNLKGKEVPEEWAGKVHTFRDFVWHVRGNAPTPVILKVPKGVSSELKQVLFSEGIMVKESEFSFETVSAMFNKFKKEK
jgi:hypothetical protein